MVEKKVIVLGADHGGYELKEEVEKYLKENGYCVMDLGTNSKDSVDYPDFGARVAEKISRGENERGILICGTGIGMSIVANRYPNVRGALCHDEYTAQMSREHNDSNLLIMGGRVLDAQMARRIVDKWLHTDFAGGRHKRRIDKIESKEGENDDEVK